LQNHPLYKELQIEIDKECQTDKSLPSHPGANSTLITAASGKQKIKLVVAAEKLPKILMVLKKYGAVLLTLVGVDEREINNHFGVYPVFFLPTDQTLIEIKLTLDPVNPSYPAVTSTIPSAHWLEREIKDLLGIVPQGHPDPRRLAVHPDWPKNVFPLRRDFVAGSLVPRVKGELELCSVQGEGLYQFPVGPVHAGIIEPGHFRFFAFGEDVIDLQAQLFYTHRGVEKAAEGKRFNQAALIAERVCGACSASHSVAYAQAVESLAGVVVPVRARYIRTILLEMERLYNHVGDIGNLCAGIGFSFAVSRGAILKEHLMRLNMRLTGHRYLRGTVLPGGVKIDWRETSQIAELCAELTRIEKELKELTNTMLASHSLLDRMQTTGILAKAAAENLGAVGPAARASAIDRDLRRDLPYAAYREVKFDVPVQKEGDVFCRLKQRIEECEQSFAILRQAFAQLPPGELMVEIPKVSPCRTAIGYTESARGANVHWVMSGPDNTIYRYMVRSASHCNWPVLPSCVPGNIIPDFPLINKSFELCYACLDR